MIGYILSCVECERVTAPYPGALLATTIFLVGLNLAGRGGSFADPNAEVYRLFSSAPSVLPVGSYSWVAMCYAGEVLVGSMRWGERGEGQVLSWCGIKYWQWASGRTGGRPEKASKDCSVSSY